MSKHLFKTKYQNEPIIIHMGWDRPLQGFFMFIERPNCNLEEGRYLYSNLDNEESHPKRLSPFLEVLRGLGLVVPDPMIDEVLADKTINCGNKIVEHQIHEGAYKRIPLSRD